MSSRRRGRSVGAGNNSGSSQGGRSRINNNDTSTTTSIPKIPIADMGGDIKSKSKKDLLYTRCAAVAAANAASSNNSDAFTQADLMAMGIASDLPQLMNLCQELVGAHRFQIVELDGQICYRVRALEFAQRLEALEARELLVYNHIDQAGTSGIWTKTLKARTNLHQTVMTRVLKSLESQSFIKQTKLVKHPGRKIYMRYDLDPGDEATGGPWYSDGELDVDFVDSIAAFIVDHVRRNSWREGPRFTPASFANSIAKGKATKVVSSSKITTATTNTTANASHREPTTQTAVSSTGSSKKSSNNGAGHAAGDAATPLPDSPLLLSRPAYPHLSNAYRNEIAHAKDPRFYGPALNYRGRILVPYEPGYMGYPTAPEILTFIDATGIVKGKDLTTSDLRMLLDMLVFDCKLERVGRKRVQPDAYSYPDKLKGSRKISSADHESDDEDDEDEYDEEEEEGEDDTEQTREGDDTDDSQNDNVHDQHDTSAPRKRKQQNLDEVSSAKRRKKGSVAQSAMPSNPETNYGTDATEWKLEYMYRAVRCPSSDGNNSLLSRGVGKANADAMLESEPLISPGNGFTEAPCSRCPVFRLCEEGGPADARNCAYFEDWLQT